MLKNFSKNISGTGWRFSWRLPVFLLPFIFATEAHAQVSDYPTLDRVLFVERCAQEYPDRPRHEILYKCVCVFDQIASTIPYESFDALETSQLASSIKGERGRLMRQSAVKQQASRYRSALDEARQSCLLPPPHGQ